MAIRPPTAGIIDLPRLLTPLAPSSNIVPFFRHNAREPVIVTTAFDTRTTTSIYLEREQRSSRASRPVRSCRSLHTAMTFREMSYLQEFLEASSTAHTTPATNYYRTGMNRNWISGLYSDEVSITGVTDLGGGSWQLDVNTRNGYRFFAGGRCFFYSRDPQNVTATIRLMGVAATIAVVNTAFIQISGVPTEATPAVGMCLVPAMNVAPIGNNRIDIIGNGGAEVLLETDELPGDSALPVTATGVGGFPFPRYNGLSTFDANHNWRDPQTVGLVRTTLIEGAINVLNGEYPRWTTDFSLTMSRSDFWPVLRLFEASRGDLIPFWCITDQPITQGTDPIRHTSGTATVPLGTRYATRNYRAVAFRDASDCSVFVREVVSTTFNSVTLDSAVPVGNYYMSVAYMGRFAESSLTENWITSEIVECAFSTIELTTEEQLTF